MNRKTAQRLFYLGVGYLALALLLGWLGHAYSWGGFGTSRQAVAVDRAKLAVMLSCTFVLVSALAIIASFILPVFNSVACRGCGYDLRGQLQDVRCPECGRAFVSDKKRPA